MIWAQIYGRKPGSYFAHACSRIYVCAFKGQDTHLFIACTDPDVFWCLSLCSLYSHNFSEKIKISFALEFSIVIIMRALVKFELGCRVKCVGLGSGLSIPILRLERGTDWLSGVRVFYEYVSYFRKYVVL